MRMEDARLAVELAPPHEEKTTQALCEHAYVCNHRRGKQQGLNGGMAESIGGHTQI